MSKIPASNPPQKIAAKGRAGKPVNVGATEEGDEVLMGGLSFLGYILSVRIY